MPVIQFRGSSLIFEGSTRDSIFDEEQVYQTSPCIRVHLRNLVIMACNVENFQNQGVFITFDKSLTINDTILKGFQVYVDCENNGTKLSMNHSIIKSDCQQQQQPVLIHADNLGEFAMELTNSIIEGSLVIMTNSKNVEITIKDNEFKNQQISISFENVKNKSITIQKNIFYLSRDYGIKISDVLVDKLQLFKTQSPNVELESIYTM
ncbi:unnamed protein product [Paramecium octaurelia]|uniref:Uncharacterized protein n=1 Tax=Paramecium octaurelia TaxID=43137 RepID=A0A8S1YKE5_PAROT|nr:unnamed protein product [Paramecium octaurelia]